jgi:hypothetical protein
MRMGRGQSGSRRAGVMGIVGIAVMAAACTSPAKVIPRAKNVPQTTTTLADTSLPPSVTSTSTSTEPSTTTTTVRVVGAPLPPPQPTPTVPPTSASTPAAQPLPTQLPCPNNRHKNRDNCSGSNQNRGDESGS